MKLVRRSKITVGYAKDGIKEENGKLIHEYEEYIHVNIEGIQLFVFWIMFILNSILSLVCIFFICTVFYFKSTEILPIIMDLFNGTLLLMLPEKFIMTIFLMGTSTYAFFWIKGMSKIKICDFTYSKSDVEYFLAAMLLLTIATTAADFIEIFLSVIFIYLQYYALEKIFDTDNWVEDKIILSLYSK